MFIYQLVLIGSDGSKCSEVKNKSFMPHSSQVNAMTSIPLLSDYYQMNSRLKLVHGIEYDLTSFVSFVVCQFDFFKGEAFAIELFG